MKEFFLKLADFQDKIEENIGYVGYLVCLFFAAVIATRLHPILLLLLFCYIIGKAIGRSIRDEESDDSDDNCTGG